MEMRQIGKNGPSVSALGLGAMGMSGAYGKRDEAQSIETLHRALALGVTFFDTANVYGKGHNEELLGRAFKGRFASLAIATKCGLVPTHDGGLTNDCSPAHITASCEASLTRLGTETIDLYYLHRADPKVPIEDSIGALAALKKAGKIRHLGLSEVNAETLRRASKEHPIAALQSEYSIFERRLEAETLPAARALGIALVPYCPLGRGLLTGAIRKHEDFGGRPTNPLRTSRLSGENLAHNVTLVDAIGEIATAHDVKPAQIALAWILAQGPDIIPIPGMSRIATLEENLRALAVTLTAADKTRLAGLAAAVSGSRYSAMTATMSDIDTPLRA